MAKHKRVTERPLVNQKIREARIGKGLTQQQAAEKMGILYNTYQIIERRGNITFDWVLKFCEVFDVPRSFFKEIFTDEPSLDDELPKNLTFKVQSTIEEKLYGDSSVKEEDPKIIKEVNNKTIMVEITHTENSLINTYRGLSKAKQKEFRDFINSIK